MRVGTIRIVEAGAVETEALGDVPQVVGLPPRAPHQAQQHEGQREDPDEGVKAAQNQGVGIKDEECKV